MRNQTKRVLPLTAVVIACLLTTGHLLSTAEARCRWVWQGPNSYYVCDEDDVRARLRPRICDFKTERGPRGNERSRTVFCRPDGSLWKEIVVGPYGIVVKIFRHDGSLASKKRFSTDGGAARPGPQWKTKSFRTSLMGIKVKGTVERLGRKLRGVVYVYRPFGAKDTYHFTGKIRGDRITASHGGGHRFEGRVAGDGRLMGVLTTKGGLSLPINVPFRLP
jgi:hypothetical protein